MNGIKNAAAIVGIANCLNLLSFNIEKVVYKKKETANR